MTALARVSGRQITDRLDALDRRTVVATVAGLVAVVVTVVALDVEVPFPVVVIGALTGLTYALLAAGLVLVYRATRVVNFAHGEIGALGATVLAKLVLDLDWNFFAALALVVAGGGALGALVELTVVRRLFEAPRLILLVATIGVAQLAFVGRIYLPGIENAAPFPSPLSEVVDLGSLNLLSEHFLVLAFVPAVILGLSLFLALTPYGIAIRAAAGNPDAARLAGISVKRVSTVVWALAGAIAVLTVVLISPIRNIQPGVATEALGPGLLLRALTAALVGRLVSLPLTFLGGIAIGVVEGLIFANASGAGIADLVFFVLVLGLLLAQGGRAGGREERATWSLSPRVPPVPPRLRGIWWVRNLNGLAFAGAGLAGLAVPVAFGQSSQLFRWSQVLVYAMIALSLTVLTGWAGQLSLGQFGFVGIGAVTVGTLTVKGTPFGIALVYAAVAGAAAAVAVGFPALRIRGLFLAITTLAFAVATRAWLLELDVFRTGGTNSLTRRGEWLGVDLTSDTAYYYVCLAGLAGATFVVASLRRSGIGRVLLAVRDNEAGASAYTVSPARAKLTAFAVSGALAAVAGGLLGGLLVRYGPDTFGSPESLRLVAITIIGGLGSVAGSLLGPLFVVGLPALFGNAPEVRLLTSGIGLLVLLLYLPGGLVSLVHRARGGLLAFAERRYPELAEVPPARLASLPARPSRAILPLDVPALEVVGTTVRFGGRVALDAVDLIVHQGEVVGLIGSNGAGKSTLMNAICGLLPAEGSVRVLGTEVSGLAPHERARAGLGRAFQDARLFGDLSVREAVAVALEAREASELVPSLLSLPPARRVERRKAAEADELIGFLGLGRYADRYVGELSTGTRRIAELACLLALDARVLLLDEPTAGVAQRETEAFGPLILRLKDELGATVVIIEHDIPLVLSMSDRVYCLGAGTVIAEGLPFEVRDDPKVVASYLGTDERAIVRSGAGAANGGGGASNGRRRQPLRAAGR